MSYVKIYDHFRFPCHKMFKTHNLYDLKRNHHHVAMQGLLSIILYFSESTVYTNVKNFFNNKKCVLNINNHKIWQKTFTSCKLINFLPLLNIFQVRKHCQQLQNSQLSKTELKKKVVYCTYTNEFWVHRQWFYPEGIHIWGHWIIKVLGTDRSIAQGYQVRAIEHINLLPAPWGKCSSLLTDGTLNNCFITMYLIIHYFSFWHFSTTL